MERISAACAMEWSIELEKSLRSKRPGQAVKAIQQFGARLQQWSREPKPTMAVYHIFGLVMGEDRVFANTIFLRLADVFRLGDRDTRLSIVSVFLSEFRNHVKGKKGRRYEGILSKDRIHNHMELLKRVKIVYDTGDVESRAMALVLFGCWADFAKDSAHIRYLILSSLVSSEILEVKASLFAASCFCELAADFAYVVLEMLPNIMLSPDTSLTIRLAGVRVIAKMGSSYSTANSAYKIGLKLLSGSSEEDFLVAVLVSLSKLANRSTFLLSEQVNLLWSFLSSGRTLRLQATALRCLHFMYVKGVCQSPVNSHVIKILLRIIDDIELPSTMQYEALQISHKILLYGILDLPCDNMLEFTQLLNIIEKAANLPITPKSLLAVRILVDLSTKLRGGIKTGSDGDCFLSLPKQIISSIMNWIISLVLPLFDVCQNNSKAFQEFQVLLNLLLCLVGEDPDLGVFVLHKFRSFIENLMDTLDSRMATRQAGASVDELVDFRGQNGIGFRLLLVYNVHRFFASCIENLNEIGTITTEILDEVQFLVERVQSCKLFDHYTHLIYSILLHSHIIWGCVLNKNEESCSIGGNLGKSLCNHLVAHEIFSLELAEKMIIQKDNWHAYKAGTFAAYQGAWVTTAFIFEQLLGKAQSNTCSCWLKGLSQLAQSEVKIQLFLLPNLRSSLVDWLQLKESRITNFADNIDEIARDAAGNINQPDYVKVLVEAYHGLCLSGEILKSTAMLGKSCFQRWFLALRAKVLRTVVDTLEILGTISLIKEYSSNNGQVEKTVTIKCLNSLRQITQISFQLKSLTEEIDIIVMSFIGMDSRSSKIISALALSCSLLAFITGFVLFISNLPDHEILTCGLECSRNYLQGELIQNLVGQLWFIDQGTCSKLFLLSEFRGRTKDCFHLRPRNQIVHSGGNIREIRSLCEYAVSGILGLQNETKRVPNEEILSHTARCGSQLVLKTIMKWINIPFRIPKYFFKLRPCIGSELFAFSADTRNPTELTLLPGFHLSLNLCLQLRNMPSDLIVRMTKLYCVLCSSASFQEPKSCEETRGEMHLDYQPWEISSMIAMNRKLLRYVTEREKKIDNGKSGRDYDSDNDEGKVYGFVCFEVNDRGQGFSNCLLDVSNFPVGSYRIKWHSCLIDNQGSYWSLLPLNGEPVFTVQGSPVEG
ncbi:uncharacterized protein LOC8271814 [Ricinus communis]|uniref:uncharacterized protein LOC8271814 n=1 Tax=Ricinus communis TaxID=3988 RepID=UPI00201AD34F|nr:uncharacterized protein LOC8271814 [Ricinus communis]XP_015582684.2 uncharacterized protein LOC8271814 [Ricinus communis]XP_015582685.2 uncharacterized protein LOC8271814 [Ricinus communis]